MNRFLFLSLVIIICFSDFAKADIPRSDIVKLKINGQVLYMEYESRGKLRNKDLCYYSYTGEYESEVKQVVYGILKDHDQYPYTFFKQLHVLDIRNIPDDFDEDALYLLAGQVDLKVDLARDKITLLSAINGNTYGYTYSMDLNRSDNVWIKANKIVKLFDFSDNGLCDMSLFAIKGRVSKEEVKQLKSKIKTMFKDDGSGDEALEKLLKALYKRKIIMIGFCSC